MLSNASGGTFFADLSYALFESLSFENRLLQAARLSTQDFSDWCAINIQDEESGFHRFLVLHQDPLLTEQAEKLRLSYPPLRHLSEKTLLLEGAQDMRFFDHPASSEEVDLLKSMGCAAFLIVPLRARGKVFGSITFARAKKNFLKSEVSLAEEVARVLALSADNARLYEESQKAIRIREEILAVVSHDLKNPLSAIRLVTQVFQRNHLPTEDTSIPSAQVRKMIHSIERSVDRAIHLITDLLDFSKATSGKMEIQSQPIAVANLISDCVDFLKLMASERNLELTWENPGPEVWAHCEPDRVHQVLSNLIGNSIKFTPPGGAIRVRAFRTEEGIQFSVKDTGPGIPASDIPHLFELYWQAKATKKLGSGLGLPICKGIVDAHRGRIWAESEPGRGSVFHFTLPKAEPKAAPKT